ncbi:hypothetical protein KY285_000812 [Solanum tuberosum]|nr:hypothetical protein KY289_001000 [Solanum tuberosum]KAH0764941.1 hypothetical protein KY285_000812 [Solanum tuberosum]
MKVLVCDLDKGKCGQEKSSSTPPLQQGNCTYNRIHQKTAGERRKSTLCIYKLRTSRTVVSDAHISNEYTLGVPGEPFAFSQCHNRVIVAEASGLTGEISQLEKFIREKVKP